MKVNKIKLTGFLGKLVWKKIKNNKKTKIEQIESPYKRDVTAQTDGDYQHQITQSQLD